MVSGNKDFLLRFIKTHVTRGVSRGIDAPKGVISDVDNVVLFQDTEINMVL